MMRGMAFFVEIIFTLIAVGSPFWLPVVFVAYGVGRRQYTLKLLLAAVTAEAIGIALCLPMLRHLAAFLD